MMVPFAYERASTPAAAVKAGAADQTAFLAGGTSLIDLMKLDVLRPQRLIDVTGLDLKKIEIDASGAQLGALATNTALARHPGLKRLFPVLSEALLSGASPQL